MASFAETVRGWFRRQGGESGRISVGRVTEPSIGRWGSLSPLRSRTADVLKTLRKIPEETQALDFLRKVNPDVSMAVWNFIRLSNLGHEMTFTGLSGRNADRRLKDVEAAWREFAARVNEISNAGFDGLLDQLHKSAFLRGAQAVEVEVAADLSDIVDIYPIVPQTIEWEWENRDGRKVAVPYQQQAMRKVSLWDANFFWVPTDPDIDDPRGTLVMAPVLQAIDFQMQILQDLQQVIHNQGWPRYDVKILRDQLLKAMPPAVKSSKDPKAMAAWLADRVADHRKAFASLEPDSSFVHTDDIEIDLKQGAGNARSLDVRAVVEMLDQQTLSGLKQMAIFLNRIHGSTETWGTVQFRIFVAGIASAQRGSKRIAEQIAALWLRVKGLQAKPLFTHNTIDWESEEARTRVGLMKQQFWAISQLMGWVDADRAASEVVEADRAAGEPREAIRITFQAGGDAFGRSNDGPDSRHGPSGAQEPTESAAEGRGLFRVLGRKGGERE